MQPTLETDRLVMRPFGASDSAVLAEIYADPEVVRYIGDGKPFSRLDSWRSLAGMIGHWQLRGYGQWALVEKSSGELVGRAGLYDPDGWVGLELAWLVRRSHWGRGYATEAARAALDWSFGPRRLERLVSVIQTENRRSIRVAEKLGMVRLRTEQVGEIAAYVYGLTRSEARGPSLE